MTIFIDGNNVVNAVALYQALDVEDHKKGNVVFCMKESSSKHQNFTVFADGTIGLDSDLSYVLGTNET